LPGVPRISAEVKTVKTDSLLDELMVATHYREGGELWKSDWIMSAAILTKIWIDVFKIF